VCLCVLLVSKLKTGEDVFIEVLGCCGPHKLLLQCGLYKRILCWGCPNYTIWTTIHPTESTKVHLFQPKSYVSGLYNPESMCNLDYKIRTAPESFGRWSAPHITRLSIVLVLGQVKKTCFYTFFDCIKCRYTPCNHSFPINSLPNHTILSHPFLLFLLQPSPSLPSTTMIFHRWPFIEIGLFGNFQGLYEKSMGIRSIVFFFPSSSFLLPCLPSNSEATSMSYQPEPLV